MPPTFRLHWLRENGCDAGTPIRADELEPVLFERVVHLAGEGTDLALHLPFLDRREWKQRAEILSQIEFVREGNEIRYVLDVGARTRDRAATLAFTDPDWLAAPRERNSYYFQTWQQVSVGLQQALRTWIPEIYFRDAATYEDRESAYPLIVYEACRLCYGRPRTEFTYDISDAEMLSFAFRMIGRSMQTVLAGIETRLYASGRPELARRYAPVWHEDILKAVRRRPKELIGILADEAALVNAVIDVGTVRNADSVRRFSRAASLSLRNLYGQDLRPLAPQALDETTNLLRLSRDRRSRLADGRAASSLSAARRSREPEALRRPSNPLDRAAHLF